MRHLADNLNLTSLATMILLVATMVAAVFIGPLIGWANFGIRELVIFILFLLFGLLLLIPSQQVLKIGLSIWILTFGFGWRTVHLTSTLSIHPAEILIGLLFFGALAMAVTRNNRLDWSIPLYIPIFLAFGCLGVVTALNRGTAIDLIAQEFKIFLAFPLSYYAIKWLVTSRRDWERYIWLTILVTVYVSGLGMMDYFAPEWSRTLTGNETIDTLYLSESYRADTAFTRVGFIFYGNFSAGFFIFTFFGLVVYYLTHSLGKNVLTTAGVGSILLLQLTAMYLSGFRGLWYAIGTFLVAFAFVRWQGWVLLGAAILSVPLLPTNFWQRFSSLFDPQYADSSQFVRFERIRDALDLMQQSPVAGVGWGGSGYVHSDLIQIGANLGAPAMVIFVLGILVLMWQLFRLAWRTGWVSGFAGALFATLAGLMVVFAGEGLIVWIQLMAPIWFLIAMSYKLIELNSADSSALASIQSHEDAN